MPFCATCGAAVEGRFCAKCGSAVAAGGPPAGAAPPYPQPSPSQPGAGPQPVAAAGLSENAASALCYLFLLGILFLVLAPYNQNRKIKFHAFQGIFLCVVAIALSMMLSIVMSIAGSAGFFGYFFLWMIFRFALFILWLYVIISTYQGKTVVLPIIGPLAQQQAG
jgi:uncharacterized membrane protein